MNNNLSISIENVSKEYRLGVYGHGTLYRDLQSWWARLRGKTDPNAKLFGIFAPPQNNENKPDRIWALRDVYLEVGIGQVIGIIGQNGAGTSTLLKLISKITAPTTGIIKARGRIASLLEVGTGFHDELTGRENIYMNGTILGMSKKEIDRKLDEITAFAEVENYIDTPVKRYSSGMRVRLAFAVAAYLEPEILLVDEVLAVGDIKFQKKCIGKMSDVSKEGRTVLFVSHNMGTINQLCPYTVWIHDGQIKKTGETASVVNDYLKFNIASNDIIVNFQEDPSKDSQLRSIRPVNKDGVECQNYSCDEPVVFDMIYQVHRALPFLYGCFQISKDDGTIVLVSYSFDMNPNPFDGLPEGMHKVKVTIPPRTLAHGDYRLYFGTASKFSSRGFTVDECGTVCKFRLDDLTSFKGNKRLGHFSTLLNWDVSKLNSYSQ